MKAIFHYRSCDNINKRESHIKTLKTSISQFQKFNVIPVYLITDILGLDIEHVNIVGLCEEHTSRSIQDNYKHMSSNPYEFELACILRWCDINSFITQSPGKYVYIESDILVYDDVRVWFDITSQYKCTLTGKQIASPMIINDHKILDSFITFINNTYSKSNDVLDKMTSIYRKMQPQPGGISDMLFLKWFFAEREDVLSQLDRFEIDNKVFDYFISNINAYPNYNWDFKYDKTINKQIKNIQYDKGLPYCINNKSGNRKYFRTLHFLGPSKKIMHKYISS